MKNVSIVMLDLCNSMKMCVGFLGQPYIFNVKKFKIIILSWVFKQNGYFDFC